MNPVLKYLHHKFINTPNRWHPFLAVYYLTYQCDFRCPYCSNGFGKPYYQLSQEILPQDEIMGILARIRNRCDYLVITGGEPLKHPEFAEVVGRTKNLRFRNVALNTNGNDLHLYLPQISESVHTLIFSLDTLNEEKADKWFGKGKGTLRRILSNIMLASEYPRKKYQIVISSVVTSQNIPDLYEIYAFAKENGFTFAACPELMGVKPPNELLENGEYKGFFDFLIDEKKKGMSIHGSPLYLSHMRDFKKFSCHPFTMLVVDPLGQVFYPCLEIGHSAGNILKCEDLHAMRQRGLNNFGPQPNCGIQCHSACALGFSLILEHPLSMVQELFLKFRSGLYNKKHLFNRDFSDRCNNIQ